MTCDCGSKNQTPTEVYRYLKAQNLLPTYQNQTLKGIAIFCVSAPEIGPLSWRPVFIENISFKETQLRALQCLAFKWFPFGYPIHVSGSTHQLTSSRLLMMEGCVGRDCRSGPTQGCRGDCFCFGTDQFCASPPPPPGQGPPDPPPGEDPPVDPPGGYPPIGPGEPLPVQPGQPGQPPIGPDPGGSDPVPPVEDPPEQPPKPDPPEPSATPYAPIVVILP